jgi:hypothetical protein
MTTDEYEAWCRSIVPLNDEDLLRVMFICMKLVQLRAHPDVKNGTRPRPTVADIR